MAAVKIENGESISRDELIKKLKKMFPDGFIKYSEEFDEDWEGCIWMGDARDKYDRWGYSLFDYEYYGNDNSKYSESGARRHFEKFLEKNGWYVEWYDPGTVFLVPC